jgi:hypothetical protein
MFLLNKSKYRAILCKGKCLVWQSVFTGIWGDEGIMGWDGCVGLGKKKASMRGIEADCWELRGCLELKTTGLKIPGSVWSFFKILPPTVTESNKAFHVFGN